MLKLSAILFVLLPASAVAQSYLVEPTLLQCEIRSGQQCKALNCDGGILQGSIAGTVLTVTNISGTPAASQHSLTGTTTALAANTHIVAGTCSVSGTTGTCTVAPSQIVASEIMIFGQTGMWWPCQVLATATTSGGIGGAGGTAGVQITPGDASYGATTTNQIATSATGLTAGEQAALQTVAQLGTALPFVIATATWKANLTQAQITAIQGNSTLASELTAIIGPTTVNINSVAVQTFVSAALTAGAITQATATALLAPQATIANP